MDMRIKKLMDYLDKAHSVFHAVAGLVDQLKQQGYEALQERDEWKLVPGGKYYLTRGGSAVMAFRIPELLRRDFS